MFGLRNLQEPISEAYCTRCSNSHPYCACTTLGTAADGPSLNLVYLLSGCVLMQARTRHTHLPVSVLKKKERKQTYCPQDPVASNRSEQPDATPQCANSLPVPQSSLCSVPTILRLCGAARGRLLLTSMRSRCPMNTQEVGPSSVANILSASRPNDKAWDNSETPVGPTKKSTEVLCPNPTRRLLSLAAFSLFEKCKGRSEARWFPLGRPQPILHPPDTHINKGLKGLVAENN